MTLAIVAVTADIPMAFAALGPAEVRMRATVFSGACRLEKASTRMFGGRGPVQLGFYVPDAGPIRPSHMLATWVDVSLAWTEIVSGNHGHRRRYGVDDAQVQLVNDDTGAGSLWPYVSFTAYGGSPMLLRYRFTVSQPDEEH